MDEKICHHRDHLSDPRCDRCSLHPKLRENANAKDQKRIEHDIDHTADHHTDHGNFHPAHRLEDLLKTDRDRVWNNKQKYHIRIIDPQFYDRFLSGKHGKEIRHDPDTEDRKQNSMNDI